MVPDLYLKALRLLMMKKIQKMASSSKIENGG
jgi:hypothetical protein